MATIITLIVCLGIIYLPQIIRDYKFSNRVSPPGYETDWNAMNRDLMSGKDKNAVKDKYNKGGYNIPKKEK